MTSSPIPALATRVATRYVAPLRQGGSLPAVMEMADGGLMVVKFRGAGQGARALVAEILVGGLARSLGLPVPELSLVQLDAPAEQLARDEEIRDLLRASEGLNLGMGYLESAFNYEPPGAAEAISPELAAATVWLDALCTNIDRTARNPNILLVGGQPWLIDHGAALFFHHNWPAVGAETAGRPFPQIRDHVLLPLAGDLRATDERLAPLVTRGLLEGLAAGLPDDFLSPLVDEKRPDFLTPAANRAAYVDYFLRRLAAPRAFVDEAVARQSEIGLRPDSPLSYRR